MRSWRIFKVPVLLLSGMPGIDCVDVGFKEKSAYVVEAWNGWDARRRLGERVNNVNNYDSLIGSNGRPFVLCDDEEIVEVQPENFPYANPVGCRRL